MIAPERSHRRRWNSWHWDVPLAALAGMAAILLLQANQPLFLGFNRLGASIGGGFWAHVTLLGDTLVAMALLLPLVRRWPNVVWAGLLAALLATLFVHGFKHPLQLPRPVSVFPREQFHIVGRAYFGPAFPSGHTATAFVLAGVILLHLSADWRRRLAGLLLALAGLIGLSRIMVGAHWPLDVLGGAAGGWLSAVLGTFWARRWPWGDTPSGRRWLTLILVGCALSSLLHYKTGYPQTDDWRRILVLCCLGMAAYQLCVERWGPSRSKIEPNRIDVE